MIPGRAGAQKMVEFTSQTQKGIKPITLGILGGVVALMLVGLFLAVRYQKSKQPQAASGPIVVPGMVHAGDPNYEYYKKYVKIEDAHATLSITFSKTRVATVSGVIANQGDRKLEAVELKVTLYDVYGNISKEVNRYAIRPGLPPNRPMEPLEKRGFGINIESVEQLWNPQKIQIEMTGLRYQQ
jgi:hypothetical protein